MAVANRATPGARWHTPPVPIDHPDLLQGPALTPMALIKAMALAYRARGMDPSHALAQAQIPPARLNDPRARITAAQMEAVSYAAMRELDDEALGCFERALPWGSYGLLARASLSAPTLGVALKRWCRHHGLLTDDVQLALQVEGSTAIVSLQERAPLPPELRELGIAFILRNIHGLSEMAREAIEEGQPAQALPLVRKLGHESLRASRMVSDLLDLARVEQQALQKARVDFGELCLRHSLRTHLTGHFS